MGVSVKGCGWTDAGLSLRASSLTYPAWNAPRYHLRPLWLHHIFRHYLINSTICGKSLLNIKCVFWFSLQHLFETFLIPRRIKPATVINLKKSSCKVPVIFVGFELKLNFLNWLSKEAQISSFITSRSVGTELFYGDGRTDGHYGTNSRFSQFCQRA